MTTNYIVLAHLPVDPDDRAFHGELALHPTEWVIFTGVYAREQAERKALYFRGHFHEVQVRTVSGIVHNAPNKVG